MNKIDAEKELFLAIALRRPQQEIREKVNEMQQMLPTTTLKLKRYAKFSDRD